MKTIEVENRTALIHDLMNIWNRSVRVTHDFLSEQEIAKIANYVPEALDKIPHLIVVLNTEGHPCAFLGIDGVSIEMLFVDPDEIGHGVGRQLIQYARMKFVVEEVTVNEQNLKAKAFYEHMGFSVVSRRDIDDQGNPYPILRMKYWHKSK